MHLLWRREMSAQLHSKHDFLMLGVAFGGIRMLIGGISVIYLLGKNITLEQIGMIKAFQMAVVLCLDLPLSYMADRWSSSAAIKLGVLSSAIWLFLTAISTHYSMFLIAEFFNAISLALFGGAFIAQLLNDLLPDDRKTIMARFSKYNFAGMAICAALGPLLFTMSNYEVLWLITSTLMMILFGIVMVKMRQESAKFTPKSRLKDIMKLDLKSMFGIIMKIPHIIIFSFIIGLIFQIALQFWQPVINHFVAIGRAEWLWGLLLSLIFLAQSFGAKLVEEYYERGHRFGILVICASVAMLLASIAINQQAAIIVATLLVFCALSFGSNYLMGVFHSHIDDELRATSDTALGLVSSLLGMMILPFFGAFLSQLI